MTKADLVNMWNSTTTGCEIDKALESAKMEYLASGQYKLDAINDNWHNQIFSNGFRAGIKAAIELLD